MNVRHTLHQRLVNWAGTDQLGSLSNVQLNRASADLGVSYDALLAEVKKDNRLTGDSATQAPVVAPDPIAFRKIDIDFYQYNEGAAQALLQYVGERDKPMIAWFGFPSVKIEAVPGDTVDSIDTKVKLAHAQQLARARAALHLD